MSNWKVLVIDDEAEESQDDDSRFQKYKQLEKLHYDSKGFSIFCSQKVDHARTELKQQQNSYDIILIDVRLGKWGDDEQGIIFKELFSLASKRSLVALVSAHWQYDSMKLVRDFLLHNTEIDQPLFFTFDDFKNGAFAVISAQIVTFVRRRRSLYRLEIKHDDPFHILHISDLHFGSDDTEKALGGIPNINYLCDKIKAKWPKGPHVIAVTGDIGNTGHPGDYEKALLWFQKFAELLEIPIPSPRILLVPGNHDVSIPLAAAQIVGLRSPKNASNKKEVYLDKTKHDEPMSAYASQPFNEFAAKISSTTGVWRSSPIGCWAEFGFIEYGVVFSGFNTSKKIGTDSLPVRDIDSNDIQEVKNKFEENGISCDGKNILHILLSHHSPVAYPNVRESVEASDIFSQHLLNSKHGPRLLLHGHQHMRWGAEPDGKKYMVIGAPSPSIANKSAANSTSRGVNMLSLERTGSHIKKITAESFIYLEGGWTLINLPNNHEFILE